MFEWQRSESYSLIKFASRALYRRRAHQMSETRERRGISKVSRVDKRARRPCRERALCVVSQRNETQTLIRVIPGSILLGEICGESRLQQGSFKIEL